MTVTDIAANFEGHDGRDCGEHRTVGPHRAWCFDCSEWCYPRSPCVRCEIPRLRAAAGLMLEAYRPYREDLVYVALEALEGALNP